MSYEITLFNKIHHINYLDATVMHTEKYNDSVGYQMSYFIFNRMVQKIVFQLENTGTDYTSRLYNMEVDVYAGKEVRLIVIDEFVIGYIDIASRRYYYFTNNIAPTIMKGLSQLWVITISVILFVLSTLVLKVHWGLYFLAVPLVHWIYLRIINYNIRKKLDAVLQA